jgi:acyl-coenzyme A synthetase/AMP-(fatty) acid ligase
MNNQGPDRALAGAEIATSLKTSFVVVEDGESYSANAFESSINATVARLRLRSSRRIAVTTASTKTTLIALISCQIADCEVLFLREPLPTTFEVWQQWGIDALLLDDLSMVELSHDAVRISGFAVLLTTSGTTGKPKIARHQLDTLMGRIRVSRKSRATDRWLLTYHPAGFAGLQVLLTCLAGGNTLIAQSDLSVPALLQAAMRHHPTHLSGTPTFWRAFLNDSSFVGSIPAPAYIRM